MLQRYPLHMSACAPRFPMDRYSGFRINLQPRLPTVLHGRQWPLRGFRPRSQRRDHTGFSPASLLSPAGIQRNYVRQAVSIDLSASQLIWPTPTVIVRQVMGVSSGPARLIRAGRPRSTGPASAAGTRDHLTFHHLGEHPVSGLEFFRSADLGDAAFLQHHDFVGIGHGPHPVGDDQNGLAPDQL